MAKEKKEQDTRERVITWIGIVCGVFIVIEIVFFILLEYKIIDPTKW